MHGQGKIISPDGEMYEGEFYNNFKHGSGKYTYSDGSIY